MLTSTLSASWYAGVAVIAIIALSLLLGVFKGFGKSLKGGFMTILIILCSLLLVGVLHAPVMKSSIASGLEDKLSSSSEGWGDMFTKDVYYEDGTYKILTDDGLKSISDTDKLKGTIANWLAEKLINKDDAAVDSTAEHTSVAEVCIYNLVALIMALALFLVLCIALSIICSVLKGLTKGMHDSENKAVRIIDRILGAIIGAVLGATFAFLLLAIVAALKDKVPTLYEYVQDDTICKFFYDNNPIGIMFEKIFTKK